DHDLRSSQKPECLLVEVIGLVVACEKRIRTREEPERPRCAGDGRSIREAFARRARALQLATAHAALDHLRQGLIPLGDGIDLEYVPREVERLAIATLCGVERDESHLRDVRHYSRANHLDRRADEQLSQG